jgi:hypothetical protein
MRQMTASLAMRIDFGPGTFGRGLGATKFGKFWSLDLETKESKAVLKLCLVKRKLLKENIIIH